ncbi:sulfotransferase family 2 domain-containing protein [Paracoccus cavernae]|uniref:Sulfotransferase family 2 domain-containing protein n=1 Tax=Paracoccus cavernae TaxID=1571207 RepID=A0ABT8D8L1_9RHOB|nr:sulfotransferase family 2 domain-containing protein [Paracoccus cavernae]
MNFLFNDHKIVFIHLTKNAGSSVRSAFSGPHTGPVAGEVPEEWQHLPSFTVIRNPFDRFLSAVNMFRFGTENVDSDDYYSKPRIPDLTPSIALDILENRTIPFDRSVRYAEANLKHHLWPQTAPFNCIQFAKVKLRQENLEEEFDAYVSQLGIKVTLPTVRSAKATRPIFRKNDLSPSEVSRIRHIFKDDFDLLGYLDEPSAGYGFDEKDQKNCFLMPSAVFAASGPSISKFLSSRTKALTYQIRSVIWMALRIA